MTASEVFGKIADLETKIGRAKRELICLLPETSKYRMVEESIEDMENEMFILEESVSYGNTNK